MDVYRHDDYRILIKALMQQKGKEAKRSSLARAAQCSPSWISRALDGVVHLTPDQALDIAQYFDLNETETDYLLSLVDLERANSPRLRERITHRLQTLKSASRGIGESAKTDSSISTPDAMKYYSSWVFPTVHVACMIRPLSIDELTCRLNLTAETVASACSDLSRMGVLVSQSGAWKASSKSIHLSASHPMAPIAHSSWRNRGIQHFQTHGAESGFHYSAIHCLSKKDVAVIHDHIKKSTLDCRKTIAKSDSETLAVLCVDWFELKQAAMTSSAPFRHDRRNPKQ